MVAAEALDFVTIWLDLMHHDNILVPAYHCRDHAHIGCMMIKLPTGETDYHASSGRRGGSSYRPREQGSYAAEFYSTVKTSYSIGSATGLTRIGV